MEDENRLDYACATHGSPAELFVVDEEPLKALTIGQIVAAQANDPYCERTRAQLDKGVKIPF